MQLYSTTTPSHKVDLRTATLRGLAPDRGLYMPEQLPPLPNSFWSSLGQRTFPELSYEFARSLLQGALPDQQLKKIIDESVNFPAPLVRLSEQMHILELFHGPSLAFKDFGARFMSRIMSYFQEGASEPLTILVATSGDTGGAVAAGFYDTPGIEVIILYPKGKVSPLQELQLTTWGKNITALEIDGVFDDCQDLVKTAFLDTDLQENYALSSANSINICRLIPQAFYYIEAFKQLDDPEARPYFVVPSGNFGNLTAGLMAYKMGLPAAGFVAATNANDVVPRYLKTGKYEPKTTVPTISNAMDVGAPSNFVRMEQLLGSTWNMVKDVVQGYGFSDATTREAMRDVYSQYQYVLDPHGAVGYLAANKINTLSSNTPAIILETAHPAKFLQEVEQTLSTKIRIPKRLSALSEKQPFKTKLSSNFSDFKAYLLNEHQH